MLIDKVIETAEGRSPCSMAEITRPTKQHSVQLIAHLRPWLMIAGRQQTSNLGLEPLHALLGGARAFPGQVDPALSPAQPPDMVGILRVVGRGRGLAPRKPQPETL